MGEPSIDREARDGVVTLHVKGIVNGQVAEQLQQAVEAESRPVVVDFSKVREFYDFAVAVLANSMLRRREARVTLTGLNAHQQRMFRYFGVNVPRQPVTYSDQL